MRPADAAIARRILEHLYENTLRHPGAWFDADSLHEDLEIPEKDYKYVLSRISGEFLLESSSGYLVQVAPGGIEFLKEAGYPTILDDNLRYEILAELTDLRREKGEYATASVEALAESTQREEKTVHAVLRYLAAEGLVKFDGGHGWSSVRIRKRGLSQGEFFRDHGVAPAASERYGRYEQAVGPDQEEKARRIFRDQVELARQSVVLIDPYAKEGLFHLLDAVPNAVKVVVLTSDKVVTASYKERITKQAAARPGLLAHYVKREAWPFHGRFLVVDEMVGYSWDASFHDMGQKHHVIKQMAPVNTAEILSQYQAALTRARTLP